MIGTAARASWFVPTVVLALLAVHERLPRTLPPLMVIAATASAAIGLILGAAALGIARRAVEFSPSVRANALVGVLVSASVLVVFVVAGAFGDIATADAQRTLEQTTAAALRDAPGWNGGASMGAVSLVASSLDRRSQASKVMTHPFDRALRVLVVSVDNRSGDHEIVVDLASVRARLAGGEVRACVPRADLLADVSRGGPSRLVAGPVHVAAGARLERAEVFFAEDVTFRDVEAVEVSVDGTPVAIPGRYFTLDEKKAIDRRTSAAKN